MSWTWGTVMLMGLPCGSVCCAHKNKHMHRSPKNYTDFQTTCWLQCYWQTGLSDLYVHLHDVTTVKWKAKRDDCNSLLSVCLCSSVSGVGGVMQFHRSKLPAQHWGDTGLIAARAGWPARSCVSWGGRPADCKWRCSDRKHLFVMTAGKQKQMGLAPWTGRS